MNAIDRTACIIDVIKDVLLDGNPSKDTFNDILNKKRISNFSRSNQEFYILWEILMNIEYQKAVEVGKELKADINSMLSLLKNVDDKVVNDNYVNEFIRSLREMQEKYTFKD